MRTKSLYIIIPLVQFIIICDLQYQATAQIVVSRSVFGNGGVNISDGNYEIAVTVGQVLTGDASNLSLRCRAGFWNLPVKPITSVEQDASNYIPKEFQLHQNYPNPFNPSTTIQFELPKRSSVIIDVFDVLGRKVATLVDEEMPSGTHRVVFDASGLAGGAYFYRMQAERFEMTKKLVLLK